MCDFHVMAASAPVGRVPNTFRHREFMQIHGNSNSMHPGIDVYLLTFYWLSVSLISGYVRTQQATLTDWTMGCATYTWDALI